MTGFAPVSSAPVAALGLLTTGTGASLTATRDTSYNEPAVWLAEMTTDAAAVVAVSDRGWIQEPGDTITGGIVKYPPRLIEVPAVERRISVYPGGTRRVAVDGGELIVANGDGGVDAIGGDWSLAGRSVTIQRAPHRRPIHAARSTWRFVAEMRASGVFSGSDAMRVSLRSAASDLSMAACNTYAGTGGAEGPATLKGQYKPRVLGYKRNVEPVLIDPANLIYQLTDGKVDYVYFVRDRGVRLALQTSSAATYNDLVSLSVAGGSFAFASAVGLLKTGAPASQLTVDVNGYLGSGSAATTAGELAEMILSEIGGITTASASDFYWPNATAGIVLRGGTVADAMDALAAGLGAAWWGHDSRGDGNAIRWRGSRLTPPERLGAAVRIEPHMLAEAPREIPGASPPWWRARVGYQRLDRVQTGGDLADAVTAADREYYSTQQRFAEASDAGVLAAYPMAMDADAVPGVLESSGEAQAVADELMELYSVPRRQWSVRVGVSSRLRWWDLELGSAVVLTWPSIASLSAGKTLVVRGISARGDFAELELWG